MFNDATYVFLLFRTVLRGYDSAWECPVSSYVMLNPLKNVYYGLSKAVFTLGSKLEIHKSNAWATLGLYMFTSPLFTCVLLSKKAL